MGIIGWIVLGAIAGWLASIVTGKNAQMGCMTNVIVGIVGAFIGGLLGTKVFNWGTVDTFSLGNILVATLGAVILLLIINAIRGE